MNKKSLRLISTTIGFVIAACSFSVTASAEYGLTSIVNEDIQLSIAIREKDTQADTVYIDSDDLKNGDYVFRAAVCIETEDSLEDLMHFHAIWDAFSENGVISKYITTDNTFSYRSKWNDDRTNKILDEVDAAQSHYVGSNGVHGTPYSAGPGRIYIENEKTGKTEFYDLTVDEETATATAVVNQSYRSSGTTTLIMRHYDPTTPYGERFIREINWLDAHALSGFTNAWYNEITESYNEIGGFDVIIDQDTPDGVYYIQLVNRSESPLSNYMSGDGGTVIPSNMQHHVYNGEHTFEGDIAYGLKIVVGDYAEAEPAAEAYDVNLDGQVSIDDAADVLRIYAETAAGINSDVQILQSGNVNADVDGDGSVTLSDAVAVLTEYSRKGAGLE